MRRELVMVFWGAFWCAAAGLLAGCVTPVARPGDMGTENDGKIEFVIEDGLVKLDSITYTRSSGGPAMPPVAPSRDGSAIPEYYSLGPSFLVHVNPWQCYYVVNGVLMGPYTVWHPC
jgi:hypothetical protein